MGCGNHCSKIDGLPGIHVIGATMICNLIFNLRIMFTIILLLTKIWLRSMRMSYIQFYCHKRLLSPKWVTSHALRAHKKLFNPSKMLSNLCACKILLSKFQPWLAHWHALSIQITLGKSLNLSCRISVKLVVVFSIPNNPEAMSNFQILKKGTGVKFVSSVYINYTILRKF